MYFLEVAYQKCVKYNLHSSDLLHSNLGTEKLYAPPEGFHYVVLLRYGHFDEA